MRPAFHPSVRPLWRSSDRLQVGPASLVGLSVPDATSLGTLDGSVPHQVIHASNPRVGLAASLLRLVGVVGDGPPRHPRPPAIRIEGFGSVADAARTLLGTAQASPGSEASVMLCGEGSCEPLRQRGDALARVGTRHLPVYLDAASIVVGPLVEPRTGTSCLRCQHLVRCDRDPAWPLVAAQLSTDPGRETTDTVLRRVLSVVAAALAIEQLLAPEGMGSARDGTLEWSEDGLRRRSWPRHPECPLHQRTSPPVGG